MSFFVYVFVLLVAASSVLFGLDWMQAPLQAPPRAQQSATIVQPAPTAASASTTATASPAAVAPVTTGAQPAVSTEAPVVDLATGSTPAATLNAQESEPTPAPLCDVDACERAYRTFTAADCTYKPSFEGPRRLCTKGNGCAERGQGSERPGPLQRLGLRERLSVLRRGDVHLPEQRRRPSRVHEVSRVNKPPHS